MIRRLARWLGRGAPKDPIGPIGPGGPGDLHLRWRPASRRLLRQAAPVLLALAGAGAHAACTVCTSVASGNWNSAATWSGGQTPAASGTTITINNGHSVNLNVAANVNYLTINAGGTLTGSLGAAQILTVGVGAGNDLINNGTINFQGQFSGVTQPLGYISLGAASQWSGSGSYNLYSIDVANRALTFLAGTSASLTLGAPTPFVRTTGTLTTLSGLSWNFNALGAQTIPTTGFTHGGIQTSGSGSKTLAAGTVTATGSVTIGSGTTWNGATNNPTVNLAANLTNNGSLSAGTGTYTFNGSTAQALSGSASGTTFDRLVLNNASGLTISHSVTVGTLLTLTSGVLKTSGTGVELITSASCLTSVTRTSGRVAGTLRKTIPAGSPTCAFEIGDVSSYRPITGVAFLSVTSPFTLSASSSQAAGDHASLGSSALNPARSVNRYWTLTNNGPGSPFASYSAVFNFLAGDVDAGATTGAFIVGRYSGAAWTLPTVGTKAATSTQVTGQTGFGDFAIAEPGIDHYELSLPSASLSCLPSTVTITACANASSPCSSAYTYASGASASLATAGATLGSTSVTFNGSGVASTTLSYPAASNGATASVTLSGESLGALNARKCCPDGSSCVAANSCTTTFSTAGFIVASTANGVAATVPTQTAGTTSAGYFLRAVKTNTANQACESALSGANSVDWAYECNNPTSCSASNLMSINAGSAITIQRNGNATVTGYTAVPMTFDANGNAPFNFTFGDVGQLRLWTRKTVNSAPLAGSTNAFVSKPAGFTVSAIAQSAAPNRANPAAANAAGARFVKAGESFSATITATTSTGAAAPNYGRETSPEGVLLTRTLVLPVGGAAGTLSNPTIAGGSFSNGVATVSNLAWDEVGIISLSPAVADGDYLGSGSVSGTSSGNVGRFHPDHFALTPGSVSPACSAAFTYFGQDGFTTPFTLTAQNSANATTQNYNGSFALLGLTSWSNFGFSAASLPGGSVLAASATAPSGNWVSGVASVSARHQVSLPSAATGETSVAVSAAPVDADGVTMSASAVGAGTPLRLGRLRLSNAFGSASQPLQVPVQAEYWGGNAWLLNSSDSCTTVPAAAVAISNPRNYQGSASAASTTASAIAVMAGSAMLTLAAPLPAAGGVSFDLALNLGNTAVDQSCHANHPATTGAARTWLRGRNGACAATSDRDPAARASFGIFSPESRKTVHVRELF